MDTIPCGAITEKLTRYVSAVYVNTSKKCVIPEINNYTDTPDGFEGNESVKQSMEDFPLNESV